MLRGVADRIGGIAAVFAGISGDETAAARQVAGVFIDGGELRQLAGPQLMLPVVEERLELDAALFGLVGRGQRVGIAARHVDAAHFQRRRGDVAVQPLGAEGVFRRMAIGFDDAVIFAHRLQAEPGDRRRQHGERGHQAENLRFDRHALTQTQTDHVPNSRHYFAGTRCVL